MVRNADESLTENSDGGLPDFAGYNGLVPGFMEAEFETADAGEECPYPHGLIVQKENTKVQQRAMDEES
jgi:hypothetical protein